MVIVFFSLFMSNVATTYNINYDNTTLESYNQLENLANTTKEIQDKAEDIEQESGVLDVLGGFFNQGYKAFKVTKESYTAFDTMSNEGIDNLQMGVSGEYLKVALTTIVLILIFVGVILSALLKKDV